MELSPTAETFLCRRVIFQCSVVCVRVAQEVIDVVDQKRTETFGAMTDLVAWWYNVLFLYTSATVLIAARLSPFILTEISETAIFESWGKAMRGLDHYSVFSNSIKRLITTLKLLFGTVPQHFSRLRPPPEENSITEHDTNPDNLTVGVAHETSLKGRNASMIWPQSTPMDMSDMAWINDPEFDLNDYGGLLNSTFDTNDMSWLTAVPFGMSYQAQRNLS